MKRDIDRLMQARELDALVVLGPAQHNPMMYYFTGGVHLTEATLVKKRGEDPVLFHQSIERDEAARTGLSTRDISEYGFHSLLQEAGGDQLGAHEKLYRHILTDMSVTAGRLSLYGKTDVGPSYAIFSELESSLPGLTVVGELGDSVLLDAMATKNQDEVERIRRMGQITTQVVGMVAGYLTSHRAREGVLVQPDGQPLTVRDVKRRINLWLSMEGAENPKGTIFAIGRDAGVPHSAGNPDDVLRLGQTIIFDIYPCEAGGGYYFDFTRTWCLGYASDEIQSLYQDVLDVYRQILGELTPQTPCRDYQLRTCELFEARGHPTLESDSKTVQGYVHSLGHGLGLHVHERPRFGVGATEKDLLEPGVVVTIEPGLYYPDAGMGVRLENTVWMRPDGEPEVLVDYPMDLVLPVESV
jgi:Xaa-Pro aminopeptidase